MILTEGMYLQDRYEILEKIGVGGMSVVYKAKDHTLNRNVAIKVLKSEFSENDGFLSKFRSEAQSAASLEHPNIVNVYDVGQEKGMNFIVMEYVEGITLKTYIEKKGQIGFKEAVSIAIQVAKGLEAAHNKSIIHRDIKPQNIIISTEGKVKVTDFGIARAATSDTIHSDVMGSVHYASPEQARNGFMDGKSDIYSLGIVMYEMVTGRVPFDADSTVAVALMHLQEDMVRPSAYAPDLPVSLEGIILKCTQKNPDRRYQSMGALLDDLKRALVQPDKNFAVIPQTISQKTMVVSPSELDKIRQAKPEETTEDPFNEGLLENEEEVGEETEDETTEKTDDDEEEGFLSEKTEKAILIGGIAAGVVIVIIIIILLLHITGIIGGNKSESGDASGSEVIASEEVADIEVPDLVGMDREDAKDKLNELGLGFFVSNYDYSDEYEEDQVISQSVDAGEMVSSNTTINVVLSLGSEEEVTIPDCVGMTESTAEAKLKSLNISYTVTYEKSDTVEAGTVISQSLPEGSDVDDNTELALVVSQGQDTVTIPNVTGMDQNTASSTLTAAGFTIGSITTQNNDSVAEGKVISQSIASGKQAVPGTAVDLVVSSGKATAAVTTVIVPDVTGKNQNDARSIIEDQGLVYNAQSTASTKTTVVSQSPTVGNSVNKGSTVTVYVGDGSQVEVPNLVGKTVEAAKSALGDSLSLGSQTEVESNEPAGTIVKQYTDAGSTVAKKSSINVDISKGPQQSQDDGEGSEE